MNDWLLPFLVGAWLSIALVCAMDTQRWPNLAVDKVYHCLTLLGESALGVSLFLVLVPMLVAVRLDRRELLTAVKLRAFLVGALATPAVVIAVASCFDLVQYPQLTQASPGLEIQLVTAVLLGEILVRVCSRTKPEMLGGE